MQRSHYELAQAEVIFAFIFCCVLIDSKAKRKFLDIKHCRVHENPILSALSSPSQKRSLLVDGSSHIPWADPTTVLLLLQVPGFSSAGAGTWFSESAVVWGFGGRCDRTGKTASLGSWMYVFSCTRSLRKQRHGINFWPESTFKTYTIIHYKYHTHSK